MKYKEFSKLSKEEKQRVIESKMSKGLSVADIAQSMGDVSYNTLYVTLKSNEIIKPKTKEVIEGGGTERVVTSISKELKDQFDKKCEENNVTNAAVLRHKIQEYVKKGK